tara:strand:- start:8812 stop:11109 length:2298 start_codon:yes stop_codon:yes gene_type:complete
MTFRKSIFGGISLTFFLFFSNFIQTEIKVDGELSEEEWESAKKITKFYQVIPFNLEEPEQETLVRVYETEDGLYLGYTNYQSRETMREQQHERDADNANADKVGVTIDFDGDALMAYSFTVSLGGSLKDAVYRNENEEKKDWDADWIAKTSIGKDAWFAEFFIPWSVAPMKDQEGDKRKIRISFWRMSIELSKGFATIQSNPRRARFISAFNDMYVKNFNSSGVDFFPYITASNERISGSNETKVGAEIFWKIDSSSQLNVAINPDFGQVESDDVVINFSAMETFYSDKRPFFSENQSMFDVDGYRFIYVINTRRIGGAPDYKCEDFNSDLEDLCNLNKKGYTDIDTAFRYTKVGEDYDMGFLGAVESNEHFSEGRNFFAARYRLKQDNLSYGYLGTFTDNPILDSSANVNSMDITYKPNKDLRIYGLLLNSIVEDKKGYGFRMSMSKQVNQDLSTGMGFFYLDKDLDLSDMGYLMRNNWIMLGGQTQLQQTNFNDSSKTLTRDYQINYGCRALANFDSEGCMIGFDFKNQFQNTSMVETEINFRTKGRDNMITRMSPLAPYIRMPQNYGLELKYVSPRKKLWQWDIFAMRGKGSQRSSSMGWRNKYYSSIKLFPLDNLTLRLSYSHENQSNWLNWIEGNLLATYDKTQRNTNFSIKYFKGNQHELRVKAQLVAFNAKKPQAQIASFNGKLNESSVNLDSFSIGQLAFQVRYRYEFMPLAYLYAVYTRGGRIYENDEEDDLGTLYQRPWDEPSADNFTLKLRYRF